MSKLTGKKKSKRSGTAEGRENFSPSTKKNIAAAAGFLCSIRGCLIPSTCVANKPNGDLSSANLGRASHIYAAAKNGPRPAPDGMTREAISHQSNGIWTCTGCGLMVDVLESEFSAEALLLMKRVREEAAKMAVSDPQVIECTRYIAQIHFDEVFWDHLPDLNPNRIRAALLKLKASAILNGHLGRLRPPEQFLLKPVAHALTAIAEGQKDEPDSLMSRRSLSMPPERQELRSNAAVRRQVEEIVDSWANEIPRHHPHHQAPWQPHRGYVYIQVTARDPETSAIHEPPVWLVAEGHGQHSYSVEKGQTLRLHLRWTPNGIHGLKWDLDATFEAGEMRLSSTLKALLGIRKPIYPGCEWEENFHAYERILRRLLDGWQPIGFVALNRDRGHHSQARLHPVPFDIELKIPPSKLEECLHHCDKIRLAFKLEREWGCNWELKTSTEYFDRRLDRNTIQAASDALRRDLAPPPYYAGESLPLVTFDNWDIRLIASRGNLTFQRVRPRMRRRW